MKTPLDKTMEVSKMYYMNNQLSQLDVSISAAADETKAADRFFVRVEPIGRFSICSKGVSDG